MKKTVWMVLAITAAFMACACQDDFPGLSREPFRDGQKNQRSSQPSLNLANKSQLTSESSPCSSEAITAGDDGDKSVSVKAQGGNAACFVLRVKRSDSESQVSNQTQMEFYVIPTYYAEADEYDIEILWNPDSQTDDIHYYYHISDAGVSKWTKLQDRGLERSSKRFSSDVTIAISIHMVLASSHESVSVPTSELQDPFADHSLGSATMWLAYDSQNQSFVENDVAFGNMSVRYDSSDSIISRSMTSESALLEDSKDLDSQLAADREETSGLGEDVTKELSEESAAEISTDSQPSESSSYPAIRFYTQPFTDRITVSWEEILSESSVVDLEFQIGDQKTWQSMGVMSPYVIDNLRPSQNYALKLRAVYSLESSDLPKQVSESSLIYLSTVGEIEDPQTSKSVVFSLQAQKTSIKVNWQASQVFNGLEIKDYEVFVVGAGNQWISMGTSGVYTIEDLTADMTYVMKFRIVYLQGLSDEVTTSVRTLKY